MSETRIEMMSAQDAVEMARDLYMDQAIARLNIFRTLFRRPRTAKAISELLLSLLMDSEIGHRRRELIIMRIGWTTGSEYEWTQHWPLAPAWFECNEEELLALRSDWRTADCFNETDRAVLRATDELVETGDLSDATWRACFDELGRNAAIDMVTAIGTWSLISKVARGLGIPLEDGVKGWPPDGVISPAARTRENGPPGTGSSEKC